MIDFLQRALGFAREDSPQEKLRKLEAGAHVPLQPDVVPLFASFLSLPHPDGYPPLNLSPQRQKQKTQEVLVAWLMEEAERQTVYSTWEDLHWADPSTLELLHLWADPSTLELLHLFIDQVPTTRVLALLTFRPEFVPPWALCSHMSQLTLSRLGRTQVSEMAEQITGDQMLSAEIVQQIVNKTDGVPLFVEELTKVVVESAGAHGRAPIPPLAIPATLHDSPMARLDRLGAAKEVAQLGATLGREFSYELLQVVSALDEATLQRGLAQLVEAELVY